MSKDIKKALEHCVEWNCDDCPNREELGSGETVCRGRLLPYILEYIADLEAKLAESEEYNKMLLEEKGGYIDLVSGYSKKCKNYEQQLAEKEKEIEYQENMKILAVDNQNKKAIEQLEKVKELFLIESKENPIVYDISDDIVGGAIDKDKCFSIINQQIKELKEGK